MLADQCVEVAANMVAVGIAGVVEMVVVVVVQAGRLRSQESVGLIADCN